MVYTYGVLNIDFKIMLCIWDLYVTLAIFYQNILHFGALSLKFYVMNVLLRFFILKKFYKGETLKNCIIAGSDLPKTIQKDLFVSQEI